ncbi:hypothetical protein I7I48_01282 [Histoplasma ohiense]|nr:hypothetical protein I7I48_01282 [Histoplasma ohiense (nom. inval.)]
MVSILATCLVDLASSSEHTAKVFIRDPPRYNGSQWIGGREMKNTPAKGTPTACDVITSGPTEAQKLDLVSPRHQCHSVMQPSMKVAKKIPTTTQLVDRK